MIIYHTMIYPGFDICQAAWRAFADRRKVRRWQAAAVTIQKVRWGWRWKYVNVISQVLNLDFVQDNSIYYDLPLKIRL